MVSSEVRQALNEFVEALPTLRGLAATVTETDLPDGDKIRDGLVDLIGQITALQDRLGD